MHSIRWKAGIILFLNLVILVFLYLDPFSKYADFNVVASSVLAVVFSASVTSVFLTGLYKLDKVIKDGGFSFKWLFSESLYLALIVSIPAVAFSGIAYLVAYLNFGKYPPNQSIGLAFIPLLGSIFICALILTLFFFIIPSLFIYRFDHSKWAPRIILDIFLVVFSMLVLLLFLIAQAHLSLGR